MNNINFFLNTFLNYEPNLKKKIIPKIHLLSQFKPGFKYNLNSLSHQMIWVGEGGVVHKFIIRFPSLKFNKAKLYISKSICIDN